jgi:terminase small subunit-like protein
MSRPSDFTVEIGDFICEQLALGESLRSICEPDSMPNRSTVFRWLSLDKSFSDQYARAREEQAESLADEIVRISDEDSATTKQFGDDDLQVVFDSTAVARNRLRVDARKWVASKLKPKKYGERQVLAGDPEAPLVSTPNDQIDARIAELLRKAG